MKAAGRDKGKLKMETENTILEQIQQNIEALQKQIDSMKHSPDPEIETPQDGLLDKLKEKSDELTDAMQEMVGTGAKHPEKSGVCISAIFSVSAPDYGGLRESILYFAESAEKIEKIDENRVSSALEAYSSPKRVNILKLLMSKKALPSNELTMKTGCIGGQLYHHLSVLENARIICKSGEMYTLTDYGRNMTGQVFGMVFGESFK